MEELKNEMEENTVEENIVEEPVVEQRPSTKYGRTAYQQQLQEEQAAQGQQNPYQQYQQPEQNPYQQYQNPYNAYTPYEEPKPVVKKVFAYILMVLVAVSGFISIIVSVQTVNAFFEVNSLDTTEVFGVLMQSSAMSLLSTLSDIIFVATIVMIILDIVQIYKANYKITGLVLFAIFLRPAYFIWRAHILGEKKAAGIVYAVCYYGVTIVQFFWIIAASVDLAMQMTF